MKEAPHPQFRPEPLLGDAENADDVLKKLQADLASHKLPRAEKIGAAKTPAEKISVEAHVGTGHRERLRARLQQGGQAAFHDYELLEYILGLGRREDVKPLAKSLLARFGSLPQVFTADFTELCKIKGVGETTAANIKFVEACAQRMLQKQVLHAPVLSSSQALEDYLRAGMGHNIREQFRLLCLDSKNRLMLDKIMAEGTVNHAPVYVREIINVALGCGATAIILVHNHPSGDSRPSREDIAITREITEVAQRIGITVHDHIIVGKSGHSSFKQLGLL